MDPIQVFLAIVFFWTIIAVIWQFKIKNKKVRVYPLVIIGSSDSFKRAIYGISKKWRRLWSLSARISDAIFPLLIVVASVYFVVNLLFLFLGRLTWLGELPIGSQFVVVVPFVTISVDKIFVMILIAFAIAVFPHEVFHGAVAVSEGFQIENSGLIFAIGAFGGFVEIDAEDRIREVYDEVEKNNVIDVKQKEFLRKFRRVVAAGLLANLILLGVFMGTLMMLQSSGAIEEYGVEIVGLDPNGNAVESGLKVGDIIYKINGSRIKNIDHFLEAVGSSKPGDLLIIEVIRNNSHIVINVVVGEKSKKAYIGVSVRQYVRSSILPSDELAFDVYVFLKLNIMIEIIIIMLNALPGLFLDGANWLQTTLILRFGKKGIRLGFIINIIFTVILVLNFIAPTLLQLL